MRSEYILSHCKVEGITAEKLREASQIKVPDVMKFYSKPKVKSQER